MGNVRYAFKNYLDNLNLSIFLDVGLANYLNPFITGIPHMRHPEEKNCRASHQCIVVSGLVLRLSNGPQPVRGQWPVLHADFVVALILLFLASKYTRISELQDLPLVPS